MERRDCHTGLRTHEQDGSLETLGTSLSDVLEAVRVVNIVFNGNLWLVRWVCDRQLVRSRRRRRTLLAFWMTGPSATGSLNGTPSSIMSAPPASNASMRGTVASRVGKPAVKKVTKALRGRQ